MTPHVSTLVVRFADCDQFQHVNNAKYLTYVEQSRIAYMDEVLGDKINWQERGFILARADTNFVKPIVHKDLVYLESVVTRFGNKSMDVAYRLYTKDENGNEIENANGTSVLVAFNYTDDHPMPVPAEWKEAFQNF